MRRLKGGEGPEVIACGMPPASLQRQGISNSGQMRGAAVPTTRAITSTAPASDASITNVDSVSWPVCRVWSQWSKISETQLPTHTTMISAAASWSSHPRIPPTNTPFRPQAQPAQVHLEMYPSHVCHSERSEEPAFRSPVECDKRYTPVPRLSSICESAEPQRLTELSKMETNRAGAQASVKKVTT